MFLKYYNKYLSTNLIQYNQIIIEKYSYKIQIPNSSYETAIAPFSKPTNAIFIEDDNFFLLFFSLNYFGLFQEVLKPFIFVKTGKNFHIKEKSIKLVFDYEMIDTEENRTIIFPNNYGIKKIIVPLKHNKISI